MATEMKMQLSAKERLLLLLTLLLAPILVAELFGVSRMRQAFPEAPAGAREPMPELSDLLLAVGSAAAIVGLRLALSAAFKPLARSLLAPEKRVHADRVERFATVLFKFLFYVVITTVGFVIMKDEPWFPTLLGGSGTVEQSFETLQTPPSSSLRVYFLVQLGYHTHSLVHMLLLSPIRNDFLEMLLHHVATIILIGGSYLANFSAFGALVVFTHDIGDVTGYAIKSAVDTGKTPLVVLLYFVLLASWAYTRLYVFPAHLVYNTVAVLPVTHPEVPAIFRDPMIAMLCMLVLLHVYWYVLFLAMGYNLVAKGVQEDIQQKCHTDEAASDGSSAVASGDKRKLE